MRDSDLIEFIASGRLGYIQVGSTKEDVRRAFGDPKHIHAWMEGYVLNPIAWNFDDLYIGFNDKTELVAYIGIKPKSFKQIPAKTGGQNLVSHGLKFGIEIEQYEALVEPFDLYYTEKRQWDYDGWILEYPSGVGVWFQGQPGGKAPLFEICIGNH